MTEKRPGYRTDEPFTVDDLTGNEYSTLARLIKGDPTSAFTRPNSELGGEAIAGLVMLRDRRHRADATLGTYQARTMAELQRDLGYLPDPKLSHESAGLSSTGWTRDAEQSEPEPGPSVVEQATEDAADVAGEGTDPTVPPASPSSQ